MSRRSVKTAAIAGALLMSATTLLSPAANANSIVIVGSKKSGPFIDAVQQGVGYLCPTNTTLGKAGKTVRGAKFLDSNMTPIGTKDIPKGTYVCVVKKGATASTPAPAPAPAPAPTEAPSSGNPQFLNRVFELVNQERAKVGAGPVQRCANLDRSASNYANVMATTNHYDHVGPDGSRPQDRAKAAGYTGWSLSGENIAAGFDTAEEVMNGWMNSPGHRTNILNPEYNHIGIGFSPATNSEYHTYWVQQFGAGGKC